MFLKNSYKNALNFNFWMNFAKPETQITLNKLIFKMVYEWLGLKIGLLAGELKIDFVKNKFYWKNYR